MPPREAVTARNGEVATKSWELGVPPRVWASFPGAGWLTSMPNGQDNHIKGFGLFFAAFVAYRTCKSPSAKGSML